MVASNLEPGQMQLGNFIFGEGTMFNIEAFDIAGYDVNAQDFQVAVSDEIRFGRDALKPLPIQLTINARKNWILPNIAALMNDTREFHFEFDRKVGSFAREWRSDSIRSRWGEMKPLQICREDGSVVRIYGRPGKLAVSKPNDIHNPAFRKIVCEFRRADTLAYNDFEWFLQVPPNEVMNVVRSERGGMGDAPSWLRFLLVGPMTHPVIELGWITLELDIELAANEMAEVSSYPWSRRAVLLPSGASINAQVVSPYLDKLQFDTNSIVELSWTATGTNVSTQSVDFAEAANLDGFWIDYVGPGAGTIMLANDLLAWSDSGNQLRLGTAVSQVPSVSPYQRVGYTTATPAQASIGQEECSNRIIGRSNASRTEYLFWEITYTQCWFGYHKNGEDTQLSPTYTISHLCWILQAVIDILDVFGAGLHGDNDWVYEAEFGTGAGINTTNLWINKHLVASFDFIEIPGMVSNLYAGAGMRATPRGAGQSTPGPLSEFHMEDNYGDDVAENYDQSRVFMLWRDAWQVI